MLRVATEEDIPYVVNLARKFADSIAYKDFCTDEGIEAAVRDLINGPSHEKIIVVGEGGFIAAILNPFPFGPYLVATEIAWWVEPEHRKTGLGIELLEAIEYWAEAKAGAQMITMTCLADSVGEIYEKKGYKLYEKAYMKKF